MSLIVVVGKIAGAEGTVRLLPVISSIEDFSDEIFETLAIIFIIASLLAFFVGESEWVLTSILLLLSCNGGLIGNTASICYVLVAFHTINHCFQSIDIAVVGCNVVVNVVSVSGSLVIGVSDLCFLNGKFLFSILKFIIVEL